MSSLALQYVTVNQFILEGRGANSVFKKIKNISNPCMKTLKLVSTCIRPILVCVCVWRERVVKAGYEVVRAYAHIQLMHKYKYSLHLTDFAISFTGQIQYESNGMGGGGE